MSKRNNTRRGASSWRGLFSTMCRALKDDEPRKNHPHRPVMWIHAEDPHGYDSPSNPIDTAINPSGQSPTKRKTLAKIDAHCSRYFFSFTFFFFSFFFRFVTCDQNNHFFLLSGTCLISFSLPLLLYAPLLLGRHARLKDNSVRGDM